jgi:hypothetical protein
MSATAMPTPRPSRRARRAPGWPVTAVELRKMTDTRAGFWLQLAVVALTVAVIVIDVLFGHARDQTLREMLALAVAPASILLPIVGILLVTSEWSQRTALDTFALVPRRSRVHRRQALAERRAVARRAGAVRRRRVVGTAVAAPGLDHTWALPSACSASTSCRSGRA